MPRAPESDVQIAARLATEAGHMLVALRERLFADGAEPWQIKDAGDAVSQRFLADELLRVRPDDAVLSEEGLEDPRRFSADRVWIVDPLDGTREFSEQGRVDWAVHVALWDGDHFGAGAVSLPALDITLSTDPAAALPDVDRERPRLVTSRTRAPHVAAIVAHALDAEPLALGLRRRQDDGGRDGRRRHLRPRRRPVPVGLGGPCGGGPRRRLARQPHRRHSARLQRPRPVAPRSPRLPPASTPSPSSPPSGADRRLAPLPSSRRAGLTYSDIGI